MQPVKTTNTNGVEANKRRFRKKILHYLYKQGQLSTPELSKLLGVSMPTTKTLLDDLIEKGKVLCIGTGKSNGGRKPTLYGLVPESYYVIACDMGRYNARMALFNSLNEAVGDIMDIHTNIDDPLLTDKLADHVGKLLQANGITEKQLAGFGVDMPGLVDVKAGKNLTIKDKKNQEVRKNLEKKLHTVIYVDNDARMQAFGEYKFGKARGKDDVVIIHWSWGLGLGMILNGQLYSGATGFAGELSHIKMEDGGDLCICGKRGCLETQASANRLLKEVREGITDGAISQLTKYFGHRPEALTVEDVIKAARSGDDFSITQLNLLGTAFGKGLAILIQLLNPEIIILGGPLAQARQFVLAPIQQALNRYCLEKMSQSIPVEISELGEDAGLLGVRAKLFELIFS